MELALIFFSAVSAISTATLAFLLLQIQKSLNTNAKKRTESDAGIYKQLERLLQRNQAVEQKLVELINAQSNSIDKVCELLGRNGDVHVEKLQTIADKLNTQSRSIDRVCELLRGTGDLQIGRLQSVIEMLEILKTNIANLYELLREGGDLQVGKLKTVADKIESLKYSLEESIRF